MSLANSHVVLVVATEPQTIDSGDDPEGGTTFIGSGGFFLTGDTPHEVWFFQFAFACALSSIVAGTIAERCKMTAYLCYSVFLCGFVYPVCAHAFWSPNGFLSPGAADPLWWVRRGGGLALSKPHFST